MLSIIWGTPGDDDINGTPDSDQMFGMGGYDIIDGRDGNDILWGDAGNDVLRGEDGADELWGDATLTDNPTGDDQLEGGIGNDRLHGGGGDDRLYGDDGDDQIWGDNGDDVIVGNNGIDLLWGGLGDDYLGGDSGNDDLQGEDGNDDLAGGAGSDSIDGGLGIDTVYFDGYGTTGATVNLADGRALDVSGSWDTIVNVEDVWGTHLNDSITGDGGGNILLGLQGDDNLYGGAGSDLLIGDDSFNSTTGQISPSGGNGNDLITGGAGHDVMYGGLGTDTANYSAAAAGVDVDLAATSAYSDGDGSQDEVYEFENITGSNFADILTGDSGANTLDGRGGDDILTGGSGGDTYVVDSAGDIVIELANEGTDTVKSSLTFNAATTATVEIENVTLIGSGAANVLGNDKGNILIGNLANNSLNGGKGADTLIGGFGNDTYTIDSTGDVVTELAGQGTDYVRSTISYTLGADLENLTLQGGAALNGIGNDQNNTIVGNTGNNILAGKGGVDYLTGGGGSDTFDYNAVSESSYASYDRITDLSNDDWIDLSGIDANTGVAGNQAFTLVNAFTNQAGQITFTYNAAADFTLIAADVDGDGVADMRIVLNGDHHDFASFVF